MSAHSIIAPSSSARRVQCPASTTMEARYPEAPDEDGDAAQGVAAHWAGAEQLQGRLIDEGMIAPNGVFLTKEMAEAADLWCDDVTRTLAPYGLKPQHGQVETPLAIPRVHAQSWGTPDYWVAVQPARHPMTIYLWDFKFGRRFVEVFENWQLIEYLAGIIPLGVDDRTIRVVAKIVQPRSYHRDGPIRTWEFTASAIRAHINRCSNAAHEALGPSPAARVGPECYDCRARHACPTLQADAYRTCDLSGKAQPLDLPPAAVGLELRMLTEAKRRLDARISGLQEHVYALQRRGAAVPHWRLVENAGREAWTKPAAEVIAVAAMMGVNVARPPEPVTPNQARELGLDPAVCAAMAKRNAGAVTLELDDGSTARRVFG